MLPNWQLFLSQVVIPNLGRIYACNRNQTAIISTKTHMLMEPSFSFLFSSSIIIQDSIVPALFPLFCEGSSCAAHGCKLSRLRKILLMASRTLNPGCSLIRCSNRTRQMRIWITASRFYSLRMKGRSLYLPHRCERTGTQKHSRIFCT